MKVKVIKAFRDKTIKSVLKPGQIIEIDKERFGELTEPFGIFVEEIEEDPPIDPPVEQKEETPTIPDFEKLTKTELVEYSKELNVKLNMEMTKAEMIDILLKK